MSQHTTTSFSPTPPTLTPQILEKVTLFVQRHMSNYDPSHDWTHITRVKALSLQILRSENAVRRSSDNLPPLDEALVTLLALLHDVNDHKYITASTPPLTETLAALSLPAPYIQRLTRLIPLISYSYSKTHPDIVGAASDEFPELDIVSDADRLDAIGAVGIARCFAFGGAKGRGLSDGFEHFLDKLVHVEGSLRTDEGKRLGVERGEVIKGFVERWRVEVGEGV